MLLCRDTKLVYEVPGLFDSHIEAALARDDLALRWVEWSCVHTLPAAVSVSRPVSVQCSVVLVCHHPCIRLASCRSICFVVLLCES